ncbi:MAG: hypothetical protein HQL99_06280 [Magnetococcales bacterium]|nr:hypothetical protein [Magnetococcales bacterium]
MMIARPMPARWMRLVAIDDDLPAALTTLARHAPVEPEALSGESKPVLTPELASRLHRFDALSQAFHLWWPRSDPDADATHPIPHAPPLEILDQAMTALEAWQREAEPLIRQEQECQTREAEWLLLTDLAEALPAGPFAWEPFAREERNALCVRGALFLLPPDTPLLPLDDARHGALLRLVRGRAHAFVLAVGTQTALTALNDSISRLDGRPLTLPTELGRTESSDRSFSETVRTHLTACRARIDLLQEALRQAGERHQVARWIRAVHRLQWFFQAIRSVGAGETLSQLGGWVAPGIDAQELNGHLRRSGVRALASVSDAGPGAPPLVLVNPWWAKPFEIFPRLLGMPNRHEVDPSRLLAWVAPLLFGYMFGDVGQGAVLFGIGYALRDQRDISWLLKSGGMSSIFFGLLFGSLFCSESIIPALWLHPTSRPLEVLAVPLLLGVALILTGLGFHGLGAYWQGHGRQWLQHEAGVILIYIGALLAFFSPIGYPVALSGVFAFVVGHGLDAPRALPGRLAHLLETVLQLGVNTFSFARVGAFALAHAGLSHAVVTLADLTGGGAGGTVVLILGNLLILALEGLVVSVQTTRLILFEFFVRFLGGDGRPFRPLPPPE